MEEYSDLSTEYGFNRFVKETEKMLYSFAYSITLNNEDAKDAVQEAYLRLFKARQRVDYRKNPKAYVFQIVKNVCFDIIGKRKNEKTIENLPVEEKFDRDTIIDRKKIISSALKILNKQERMVVCLLIFDGFSSKEAGEILGLSDSTIRNHYMNGRNKIRNFIVKHYPEYARSI